MADIFQTIFSNALWMEYSKYFLLNMFLTYICIAFDTIKQHRWIKLMLKYLPHWDRVYAPLVHIMVFRLFDAKPSSQSITAYCLSDPKEHISMKFCLKFQSFYSRKCIWKSLLQNGGHFVSPSTCLNNGNHPDDVVTRDAKPFSRRDSGVIWA